MLDPTEGALGLLCSKVLLSLRDLTQYMPEHFPSLQDMPPSLQGDALACP